MERDHHTPLAASLAAPTWAPWPLRLFLGGSFIWASVDKLLDAEFLNPAAPGYVGHQLAAGAAASPIGGLTTALVVPNAQFFGALVMAGELLIGLAVALGWYTRFSAALGLLINLMFYLTITWDVQPFYFGADLPYAAGWLTLLLIGPGAWSVDAYLRRREAPSTVVSGTPTVATGAISRRRFNTLIGGGIAAALIGGLDIAGWPLLHGGTGAAVAGGAATPSPASATVAAPSAVAVADLPSAVADTPTAAPPTTSPTAMADTPTSAPPTPVADTPTLAPPTPVADTPTLAPPTVAATQVPTLEPPPPAPTVGATKAPAAPTKPATPAPTVAPSTAPPTVVARTDSPTPVRPPTARPTAPPTDVPQTAVAVANPPTAAPPPTATNGVPFATPGLGASTQATLTAVPTTAPTHAPTALPTVAATGKALLVGPDQIAVNESLPFTAAGSPAVLVRLASGYVAYSAVCTHQGCTVVYKGATQHLVCPCHGAQFDPAAQAAALRGPARRPLAAIAITVAPDGSVYLT